MSTVLNVGQNYRVVGGADKYLLSLENLLIDNGHKVIPYAVSHPDNLNTEWGAYFPKPVNFYSPNLCDIARYLYSFPAKKGVERIIESDRPDIAHLHIYYGQLTASILSPLRKAKIPIVQTLHEYKLVCPTYSLLADDVNCELCNGKHFWHAIATKCNRGSLRRSFLSAMESYISLWLGSQNLNHYIAVSDFLREK